MKLKKTLKIMKMMVKVEIDVMKKTHVRKATIDLSNIPWLHKKTMHYPSNTSWVIVRHVFVSRDGCVA
jgi:hypothetical protein